MNGTKNWNTSWPHHWDQNIYQFFLVHQANRTRFEFHKPTTISGYTQKNIPIKIISFEINKHYQKDVTWNVTFVFFWLEIPDFLSENECNHIISLAERIGLRGSDVHLDEELNQRKEFLQGTPMKGCPTAKRRTFHETNQTCELSSWKVRRLAQLSSSKWVWIVQHVLSVC